MSKALLRPLQTLAIVSPLVLLNACASLNGGAGEAVPQCQEAPKTLSNLDKLLAFGNEIGKMPAAARTVQCHAMVKQQKDSPDSEQLLQLMVARTLSDACGDAGKLIEQVNALPLASYDDPLRQFVMLELETLKNIQGAGKRPSSVDKRKKKTASGVAGANGPEGKEAADPGAPVNNETRLLREKLDAIRSMEKQLDAGDTK